MQHAPRLLIRLLLTPRCVSLRSLEHESRMLSRMKHPNVVGFRAAQRLPDGQLCLALESCDCSLYNLIQERQMHESFAACESFLEGPRRPFHPLFEPDELLKVTFGPAVHFPTHCDADPAFGARNSPCPLSRRTCELSQRHLSAALLRVTRTGEPCNCTRFAVPPR